MFVYRHHNIGLRYIHFTTLCRDKARTGIHHIASDNSYIRVRGGLQSGIQTWQSTAIVAYVGYQLNTNTRKCLVQKAQVFGFVCRDNKLVGHGQHSFYHMLNKGTPQKRDRCLAASHALAFATCLNNHTYARSGNALLHEVGNR